MGKRAAFQAVLGVLAAFLFLTLPAAAHAGEAQASSGAPALLAQTPQAPPAAPPGTAPATPAEVVPAEPAPAAPPETSPAAPEAAPMAPPEALPAEPAPVAPPEAAPAAPEAAPAAPEAAPAAPPEAAPMVPPQAAPAEAAPAVPPEVTPVEAAPTAPPGAVPTAPAEAAPAAAGAAEGGATRASEFPNGLIHTVVQGDTLWDLSAKYLGSPWRWTELWERNRFLTNPHYIYPGIRVVIFPPPPKEYEMAGKEPGPEIEAAPAVAPPSPAAEEAVPPPAAVAEAAPARVLSITEAEYVRSGEFLETRPRGIGRIAGGTEVRVTFAEGDKVVLALNKEIPAGQLLGVYRVRGPVRAPAGRRVSGYVKHLVGLVQVLGKENRAVVGRVRKSFEELTRRDIITEEIPAYSPVVIDPGNEGLEAFVITGRLENEGLAQGDFVFLDRGANDGISRGNVFRLFRKAPDSAYHVEVAKAVAVRVSGRFTTAYVINSTQSFEAGMLAKRGEVPQL